MTKRSRERTGRRLEERAERKLVRDKQRLAELEPGGSAERPIDVPAAPVIEIRARSTPCPLCAGSLRLEEETAETVNEKRLRAAHMKCVRCGVGRILWFHITSPLAN